MSDEQAVAAVDNILLDRATESKLPEKVEYDMPNSYELTQLKAINDDPAQLENFIMEDNGIPLNMRLVQTKDDNEMEYMTMEDVPFNQKLLQQKMKEDDNDMEMMTTEDVPFNSKLVHIGNPDDGELLMVD
jgi:hypothetical protein